MDIPGGGSAIPYYMEDPYLREEFAEKLREEGAENRMEPDFYKKGTVVPKFVGRKAGGRPNARLRPTSMSTSDSADLTELRARLKAQHETVEQYGDAWVKRLEPELSRLPKLTFVVINCRTGEYVVGSTLADVTDEYERRFKGDVGYLHQVGGGFFVGGGIG
jgi:hypothetical protein